MLKTLICKFKKNIKRSCFFHLYKKHLKTCINNTKLYIQVIITVNTNQIKSIITATKHSLCPGNGVFAHEKCIIFVIFSFFSNNKNTTLKSQKKHFKN